MKIDLKTITFETWLKIYLCRWSLQVDRQKKIESSTTGGWFPTEWKTETKVIIKTQIKQWMLSKTASENQKLDKYFKVTEHNNILNNLT